MSANPVSSSFRDLVLAQKRGLDACVEMAVLMFGDSLRIASAFGIEDMIVLDAVASASKGSKAKPRVFFLDTGRLDHRTFDVVERVRDHYKLPISLYAPNEEEARKKRSLGRALDGASAWLTGRRRNHDHPDVLAVEIDDSHGGILRINPLSDWSDERVRHYARTRHVTAPFAEDAPTKH